MKCLSVRQPWAELIVTGFKDVENRTWYTSYRGPLLIHASKKIEREEYALLVEDGYRLPPIKELTTGSIVGLVDLVKCSWKTLDSQWHARGQYGWQLTNAIFFKDPIPFRGGLGLFPVPDALVKESISNARALLEDK